MLAVDHGYFLGPTSGLEDAGKTVKPLLPFADALMPTRGIIRTSVDPSTSTPMVLRVSGGNSILDEDLSNEGLTVAMEDAVRLNVAAVAISIYGGSPNRRALWQNLLMKASGRDTCPRRDRGREEYGKGRYLARSCRIAAETAPTSLRHTTKSLKRSSIPVAQS
jgi:putative autoinducer-2 (AI-2) aldolase